MERVAQTHEDTAGLLTPAELAELEGYVTAYKKESPRLDDFADIYPAEVIGQDKKDLAEFQAKFAKLDTPLDKERELYASVVEMALMEFSNAWMPGYVSRASEFDDIRRQTDLVLETHGDDGMVRRIAVDVTMSPRKATEKMFNTLQRIKAGWFHDPKYFASELEDVHERAAALKGRLEAEGKLQWADQEDAVKQLMEMPRIIIGTNDKEDIAALARLFLNYRNAPTPTLRAAFRERIAALPLGAEMRTLIAAQLRGQIAMLEKQFGAGPETEVSDKVAYLNALHRDFASFGKEKAPGTELARGHNKVAANIAKELAVTLAG